MDDFEEFKKMMLEASEAHFQRKEAIDKVTEIYQGYVKRIDEAENVFTGVEGDIPPPEFFLSAMTELMQFMVGFLNGIAHFSNDTALFVEAMTLQNGLRAGRDDDGFINIWTRDGNGKKPPHGG